VQEGAVVKKKTNDIALPWASASAKGFEVPLCQWPKPPPASAECFSGPVDDSVDSRFASEEGPGEHPDEEWIGHS
jgi:hypothetical protein